MADDSGDSTVLRATEPGAIPEFRLGLAMAGAISAGAYTAGVSDFLFQALSAWEAGGMKGLAAAVDDPDVVAERDGYSPLPAHRVTIAALSGASAGGITSAILAAVTGGSIEPVTTVPPPGGTSNPFYTSWVDRIDMEYFLQVEDLERSGGKLASMLDSTQLDAITSEALKIAGPHPHRPFIADPLRVFLTVANLRGVPYRIGQQGGAHGMMSHADYMEFAVTEDPALCPPSAICLDPNDYSHPDWQLLGQSALASGAFPIGLAPRRLRRRAGDYRAREWPIPSEGGYDYRPIPPAWTFEEDYVYEFMTVDGGLMNNEPLELARRALGRPGEKRNPREPLRADRAVLMVDPFPSEPFDPDAVTEDALTGVVKAMFGALKSQARFKPDELALAQDSNVYSRFMIAPTRTRPGADAPESYGIASGTLGGFGGFLARSFREHDYNLGRRNCQRFLMRHFLLSENNALFDGWPPAMKKALGRRHPDPENAAPGLHLPIVPLVGEALRETPWMEWPKMTEADLRVLRGRVGTRSGAVLRALLRPHMWRVFADGASLALKGWVTGKAMEAIHEDLWKRGQIDVPPPVPKKDEGPAEDYNKGD
ncbi:MAG: hypothetical protein WD470_12345 [Rhodospirillaceae bacterium]